MSGFERGVVLEAVIGLPIAWLAVRLLGFRICRAAFEKPRFAAQNSKSREADTLNIARRIAHLEAVTATNLFSRTSCLEQSLVLCRMLRRRGLNADLRIGARKEANRFEAHAWVEVEGNVVDGGGTGHLHFVPFEHSESSMETQTN
ncbi:MAG: lasso peptide biosynthesis B2 protein [Candidatus Acidiferrales bacterium]